MHPISRSALLLVVAFGLASPGVAETAAGSPDNPAAQLQALVDEEWRQRLEDYPMLATQVGERVGLDRLAEMSISDIRSRAERDKTYLERLAKIDREGLGDGDRVTYDVFKWQLETRTGETAIGHFRFPLMSDSGFHTDLTNLPNWVPLENSEDYRAYLSRLRAVPRFFDQHIEALKDGIEAGWTLPKVVLEGYELTISSHIVEQAEESLFFAPFQNFPAGVRVEERSGLAEEGRRAVLESVVVAYQTFLDFFRDEYYAKARESIGVSEMPGGEAYYANRVRRFTNLDISAKQVHEIGLEEVARIRAEMDAILEEVEWQGDFAGFLKFLRTDSRFYAETPEALLKEAAYISKRMDGALPQLFRHFPRQPYGVEPVPDYLAPKYTAGRYVPAPLESTRGGTYWVNTHNLNTRPLYALEALSLHEAVPGHHFQFAISKELDLPAFRRQLYISAFGEGWGLYSERLGLEVGFYTDPYSDFGRLTYEMWRACRLVVDTGLHALGWSRQKALDFLASNTALSIHEVTTEIDRYIAWPGQALAYKTGEIKIRELRSLAEKELGTRFDVRSFHDQILANGAVPLPVLESEIERWIQAEAGAER